VDEEIHAKIVYHVASAALNCHSPGGASVLHVALLRGWSKLGALVMMNRCWVHLLRQRGVLQYRLHRVVGLPAFSCN